MARFIKKMGLRKGAKPGSLIFVGEQQTDQVVIRVMQYDSKSLEEMEVDTIEQALAMINDRSMTWINIFGIHDPEVLAKLGTRFDIDVLLLEDMMNTDHRPKLSKDDNNLYVIAKLLSFNRDTGQIESDQLSLIAGKNVLVSLQEKPGTHFEAVRERIRKTKDRLRIIYSDYLAYALLDCMVDSYLDLLAEIGSSIDNLESEILEGKGKFTSQKIYRQRTELNFMRQVVLPLKELTFDLLKSDSILIRKETRGFIRDLYDHVVITHERIEVYFSIVADQKEIYNSLISSRANEIMKVLTIFAAIFIPLTFIAGIYGMNFENIPELKWTYGYLYFWGLIAVIGAGLLIYFKRKKWL
jgi:magnesium transporter